MSSRKQEIKAKVQALFANIRGRRKSTKPPSNLARFGLISIGKDEKDQLLTLPEKARAMHMHVIGSTGVGKTNMLEHLIRQDIAAGQGVCVIDPHGGHKGSLYNNIIRWLDESGHSKHRKIHLIDPENADYVTGFNPLRIRAGVRTSVIANAALNAVQAAWNEEDTLALPRVRRVIYATFMLLAEHNLTFAETELLFDVRAGAQIREMLGCSLSNRFARSVWLDLAEMSPKDLREYLEGPINRLAEFLKDDAVRNMIGQTEGGIDFREAMDSGDIVLVNLQSGDVASEDATNLLGTLIVQDLFEQCRKRQNHNPYYMYVDECHRYLSGDIPKILDEARKQGLHAILAHQRLGQLHDAGKGIYNAILGSTEIKVVMGGLFMDEAKVMAEEIIELELERPVAALTSPTVVGFKTIKLANASETHSESAAKGKSHTDAVAEGYASASGSSSATSEGLSAALAQHVGQDGTHGLDVETSGEIAGSSSGEFSSTSQSRARISADTTSESTQTGSAKTVGQSEAREAVLENRPGAVHGLDKVLYNAARGLKNLDRGEAVVSINGASIKIKTPHIQQRVTTRTLAEIKQQLFARSSSSIPTAEAEQAIENRRVGIFESVRDNKSVRQAARVKKEDDFDAWE